jgi:hypothetical protein
MKQYLLISILLIIPELVVGQKSSIVKGKITDSGNDIAMEGVNIVNINQVSGTTTNIDGEFQIQAKTNASK